MPQRPQMTLKRLALLAGLEVANEPVRPIWNPEDFFGEMFGKERGAATP